MHTLCPYTLSFPLLAACNASVMAGAKAVILDNKEILRMEVTPREAYILETFLEQSQPVSPLSVLRHNERAINFCLKPLLFLGGISYFQSNLTLIVQYFSFRVILSAGYMLFSVPDTG